MKKKFYFLCLAVMALLSHQYVMATANNDYRASVMESSEPDIIFEESFATDLGQFVVEGPTGPSDGPIWKWDEWGTRDCVNASLWSGTDNDIDSYLVSPVIKLGRENTATFNHGVLFTIPSGEYGEYFGFCVREEGSTTWEELIIPKFPKGDAKISCGDIVIPETYNGKNVQVAFRYHATHTMQLSWSFNKLCIKGFPVSESGKEYAGLEFSSDHVSYLLGGTEPFVAPELKNPNNLEVTYSSSNAEVATVDAATGEVTIKALGKTVIKAESKETDKFDAGVAEYTLNVTKSLEKLDAGLAWDVKELNTTFPQPSDFHQPVLNNPNKLAVELTTSNEGVAIVDKSTGIIHIQGLGIATITATSAENDDYKAGKATTTLIVTDATKVFAASFSQDNCMFTEEGTTGVWKWEDGCMKASGKGIVSSLSECYLVSPEFTLGEFENFMKFEHICANFTDPEAQATVMVREVGTKEWLPSGAMWYSKEGVEGFISTGLVRIPKDLSGKKVQIAFKYTTDGNTNAGEWYIRNLIVTKKIVKKNPDISYDVTEVNYAIGDGEFKTPVLNNPYNLPVEYMTSNVNVANIDRTTGEVYINGAGECTVTARCNETAEYSQGIAQYTIIVTDPYLIFRDSFNETAYGLGDFTEEGVAGCWSIAWGLASTSPWETSMNTGDESILVSPVLTMGNGDNTLTFDQKLAFVNGTPEKYARLVIRSVGGEWEEVAINYPSVEETVHSGNIILPAKYNGQKAQIGFKYIKQDKVNGIDGTWTVNNIIIRTNGNVPVEKADPEISFDNDYFEYTWIQDNDVLLESPVLNNPNEVPVKYASDNAEVVTVDELTGKLHMVGEGIAKITATSEETEKFKAATASYTFKLTIIPAGIESITADEINSGKVYDLQGRRVNKVEKGIYIVNGRKVAIR